MANKGTIKDLHPPHNNGTHHGSGKITPDDGGKDVKFHTPDDNNNEILDKSKPVYYTLDSKGKHVDTFSHINPDRDTDPRDDGGR